MKVIDAHTSTVLEVEPGFRMARARIRVVYRDYAPGRDPRTVVTREQWIPLQVRWTHPKYFLQHVAFVPS